MGKNKNVLLIGIGVVLLLAALSLFRYNLREDEAAGEQADALLQEVQQLVETRPAEAPPAEPEAELPPPETGVQEEIAAELPEVDVGGYSCVGILSIPQLELELPVISEWDYSRLDIAPCRQSGSTVTDDLVIAAHNFSRHFGSIKDLQPGDAVTFTDMNGLVNHYEVVSVDTIDSTAVDTVMESENDLVLYTCTKGGAMRVAVFCDRVENAVN